MIQLLVVCRDVSFHVPPHSITSSFINYFSSLTYQLNLLTITTFFYKQLCVFVHIYNIGDQCIPYINYVFIFRTNIILAIN
jgi:hypothetical protein